MKNNIRNFLILALGLVLGIGISVGRGVFAEREASPQLPLDELRTFTEVFARIKADYVEKVSDKTLLENAIKGMVTGLDPHSAYMNADEFKELEVGTTGEFGGLGIEVTMEDGFVKVVSPIDDTPAQKAGLKPGDLIIRLDETPVKGMSLNDAVKMMRGKPGTKITLTVVRNGQDKPFKVAIERAVIKVKSVKSRLLEPGFGYARITQFQSQTGENLLEALDKLKKENKGPLKGLVLDLRNNPGGVLNAAVSVADAFINKGLIVYTDGRIADSKMRFSAHPGDVLDGAPIVVLVNGGSASASEIVSGALQDHHRALIMGQKTFGKGSVQTILPMANHTGLKLTTARYYTPSGRSIQNEGITPDITLDHLKVAQVEKGGETVKEADLTGHLDNTSAQKGPKTADDSKVRETLAREDYDLYEALNTLKGMAFLKAEDK